MASVFTKIINGELPAYKVAESADFLAFLDIRPVEFGHTLVIPKKEVDYIFDLDESLFTALHLFSKRVAAALEQVVSCERIGTCVLGLEVPHAHIHLVPLSATGIIDFKKERVNLSEQEFKDLAAKIKAAFEGEG